MAAPLPDDYWKFFATEAARGGSRLYERLALGIRDDEKLLAIAAHARKGQPQANLILAAVHHLLLGGTDHALADHYASIRPGTTPAGDPFPHFRDFCLANEAEVTALVSTRVTNTNEAARSTDLYPAFDFIARETGSDLHLIEIGPSAGFNLNWDKYGYGYRRDGKIVVAREPKSARLFLEAELRGDAVPPLAPDFPSVGSRLGLELNPVDFNKPEDRLWLKALIWPELTARFKRLEAALETARLYPQRIWAGDALALLPNALRELPPSGIPIVYHSHVTYQFSEAMRARLNEILEAHARKRLICRVSIEWDGEGYPVSVGRYDKDGATKRVIASCDPHGSWLEWRA